jgi:hypothetical protein
MKTTNLFLLAIAAFALGGYRIGFLKGETITLYNGHTGDPQVGVAAADGRYYWTLNGAPLKGEAGQTLWVTGNDGQRDVTPQLHINPNDNQWELSTDGEVLVVMTDSNGRAGMRILELKLN